MPKVIVVTRNGEEVTLVGEIGQRLMETIRDNGISDMRAMCGGCCSCATCHVYVDPAFADHIPPMNEDENDLLESSSYRTQNSRLSCQIPITEALVGLRVEIAPED